MSAESTRSILHGVTDIRSLDAHASSDDTALDAVVALIAGLLASRTLVAWTPLVHFDIDPSAVSTESVVPFSGFGPSGSLAVDAATVAASALAVVLSGGRRSRSLAAGLAMAAASMVAICAWLVQSVEFENLWRASAWASALVGAGALVWCSGSDAAARRRAIAISVLVGVAGAWIIRGTLQLAIEHPAMVEQYRATKDAFLSAQGWSPDSVQAQTYERRLMQAEATGWFGLSNIMSGLCAAVAFACAGTWWSSRGAVAAGWRMVPMVGAMVCLLLVGLNGSKGALAALALGIVSCGLCAGAPRRARLVLAGAMIVAAIAVPLRGIIGEFWGELSLLYRWHYWIGSWRVIESTWPWGAGIDGFQSAYAALRPERAVEEVTSAHNAALDWIATLGLAGVAVTMAAWSLLWASARIPDQVGGAPESLPLWQPIVLGMAAAGVVSALADPDGRLVMIGGLALGTLVALALVRCWAATAPERILPAAVGMAAVLGTHAMVEMTAWQPGSASWVIGALGALAMAGGAAGTGGQAPGRTWPSVVVAALLAGLAVVQGNLALRVHDQERSIEAAATTIVEGAFTVPARARAAEQLVAAHDGEPSIHRSLLLLRAADQWSQAAAGERDPGRARVFLAEALSCAERAGVGQPLKASMLAASITEEQCSRGDRPWTDAVAARTRALAADPRHAMGWIRLAESLGRAGRTDEALSVLERAREVDASFGLDPLRRLPPGSIPDAPIPAKP